MRVISGSARALRLKTPEGLNTRPTTDRIKESLFNILAYDLQDICFLDLFSGSGGIGIEALSRGASKAVFVDSDSQSVQIIEDNLKYTRLFDKAEIMKADVNTAIKRLELRGMKFDIIFMDPPYDKDLINGILSTIFDTKLMNHKGFVVIEQSIKDKLPQVDGLEIFRVKEYKTTKMTFVGYQEEA